MRTPRIRHHLLAAVLLAACTLVLVPSGAGAQDAPAVTEDDIEATVGFGDVQLSTGHRLLTVTITPSRPVRGRLLVAAQTEGGQQVERRRVDIPAGGAQVHRFVVTQGFDLRVQFVPDEGGSVTVRPAEPRLGRHVIGVLGDVDVPEGVLAPVTQVTVDTTTLAADLLDLDPVVLGGLDAVVVTQADLVGLADARRATLEAAVTRGLQLLVVDTTSADLGLSTSPVFDDGTPVPGAWATTADLLVSEEAPELATVTVTTMTHGRGALTTVDDDLAGRPGLVTGVLHTRDGRALVRERDLASFGSSQLLDQVGGGGFDDLPTIWALALGMFGYLVLVGPVNALVLRRLGRMQLAWVTVPALTAVVVAGAALLASGVSGTGLERRAAVWLDDRGEVTSIVALQSTARGTTSVALAGDDWTSQTLGFGSGSIVERRDNATTVDFQLQSRQVAGVRARRTTDADAPLDVEAAIVVADLLRLEVTNLLDAPVEDVSVRVAGFDEDVVGTLAAGETWAGEVALPEFMPRVARIQMFQEQFFGPGVERKPATARQLFLDRGGLGDVDPIPGVVWVFADAPDGALDVADAATIDGRAAAQAATFVAVGVTPSPTDSGTSVFETPLRVADSQNFGMDPPVRLFTEREAVVTFDLPREGELVSLLSRAGDVGQVDRCVVIDTYGPDVPNGFTTQTVCGDGADVVTECPDDASDCFLEPGFSEVCFPDGTCENRYFEDQGNMIARVEFWDRATRTWVSVAEPGLEYVDPLGRVVVRYVDAFELDLGQRGMGATLR